MTKKTTNTDIAAYITPKKDALQSLVFNEYQDGEFLRGAYLSICQDNNLKNCLNTEEGRTSLYFALQRAASTGVSLNPQLAESVIVAYNGKATYQIMKKGLIRLALESPLVVAITADVVFEKDRFSISKSVKGDDYKHNIAVTNRGDEIGYYAAVELASGKTNIKYMSAQEMEVHAKTYGVSTKPGSAWNKSFSGMALKTVIKALLRNLHISTATTAAVTIDDKEECQTIDVEAEKGTSPEDLEAKIEEVYEGKTEEETEKNTTEATEKNTDEKPKHPSDTGKKKGDLL